MAEDGITVEVEYSGGSVSLVYSPDFIRHWTRRPPAGLAESIQGLPDSPAGLAVVLSIVLAEMVRSGVPLWQGDGGARIWVIPAASVRALRVVPQPGPEGDQPKLPTIPFFWTPDAQRPA